MPEHKPKPDPAHPRALLDEADIGSGEKTPGQLETEEIIRAIPPLPPASRARPAQPGTADDGQQREQARAGRAQPGAPPSKGG